MLGGERVAPLARQIVELVGILEKSQRVFDAEHATHGRVDERFG